MKAKRRRIFYIPGIISLMILPFIFIYYANYQLQPQLLKVIPLILADTNWARKKPELFKEFYSNFPPKRKYIDINLNGNTRSDIIQLDFARVMIREILATNDTIDGVHFRFGDSSQYWTFVKAVDILRIEYASTYMPMDNDLWFYHLPSDTCSHVSIIPDSNRLAYISYKLLAASCKQKYKENLSKVYNAS
jgi:hypothetical protein